MELEAEVKQLQHQLALVDLLVGRPDAARGDPIELLVVKLKELKVKMYQEDGHQRPHVHIDYGHQHHLASYSVDKPRRLAGSLDAKYDREVLNWIAQHRDKLREVWKTMQMGRDPNGVVGELAGDA